MFAGWCWRRWVAGIKAEPLMGREKEKVNKGEGEKGGGCRAGILDRRNNM